MKTTLSLIISLFFISVCFGQAITDVKTVLFETKYGNARLKVTPLVTDVHAKKPTKSYGVYALLVCYTYKGQQKAVHQDLTSDFEKQGYGEMFLGMSAKKSNIIIKSVMFYRRDLTPKSEMPKKTDCFN